MVARVAVEQSSGALSVNTLIDLPPKTPIISGNHLVCVKSANPSDSTVTAAYFSHRIISLQVQRTNPPFNPTLLTSDMSHQLGSSLIQLLFDAALQDSDGNLAG